jgi:LysR family cys regulon transcriptional activator
MKLQQLRYLVEVERRRLNISAAAAALFTSQPGVSKQIAMLEEELGLAIFERAGKRLVQITPPGRVVLEMASRILAEAANMKRVGEDFAAEGGGQLSIATTHTQARYTLTVRHTAFRRAASDDTPAYPAGQSGAGCRLGSRSQRGPRDRHRGA